LCVWFSCVNNTNRHTTSCLNDMNRHSCRNNAHNINVQTIQVDEWHPCLLYTNLWKANFAQLLLPIRGLLSLWCWGELNPFLLGGTKSLSPLENCSIGQLNLFPLGKHGWDYHFICPSKKILFSLRHLAWRSCLKILFHPFCSLNNNFFEKTMKAWTFNIVIEG
jgi:hypothetical protein